MHDMSDAAARAVRLVGYAVKSQAFASQPRDGLFALIRFDLE
jgi:hypothetical protein